MIGDSYKDIVPANELGMRSLLVLTGNGKKDLNKFDQLFKPDYIAENLFLGAKNEFYKNAGKGENQTFFK